MGPPLSIVQIHGTPLTSKEANLQERLAQAWKRQRIIRRVHQERQTCLDAIKKVKEEEQLRNNTILEHETSIKNLRKKEQEIDNGVIRAAALQKRTQEQMDMGKILDLEMGNTQIQNAQERIEKLEEEFFIVVEERETLEQRIAAQKQSLILLARRENTLQEERQNKESDWFRTEEEQQEALDVLLSTVPLGYQKHFLHHRFSHPNLVAELQGAFCGSCSTKQPLKIVGDIINTTTVHICSSCKAFCIAP